MVALIVGSKAVVKFAIVMLFGYPVRTGLTVGVGLAQIGEFSFILGTVGLTLGLLPADGFQLIVASSLISIALNPFLFRTVEPLDRRLRALPVLPARSSGVRGSSRTSSPSGAIPACGDTRSCAGTDASGA